MFIKMVKKNAIIGFPSNRIKVTFNVDTDNITWNYNNLIKIKTYQLFHSVTTCSD